MVLTPALDLTTLEVILCMVVLTLHYITLHCRMGFGEFLVYAGQAQFSSIATNSSMVPMTVVPEFTKSAILVKHTAHLNVDDPPSKHQPTIG